MTAAITNDRLTKAIGYVAYSQSGHWTSDYEVDRLLVEGLRLYDEKNGPPRPVPVTDEMVERAAKALHEGGDQFGRLPNTTWEGMLTFGGRFPDETDHPIANEYRRMARAALEIALNGES